MSDENEKTETVGSPEQTADFQALQSQVEELEPGGASPGNGPEQRQGEPDIPTDAALKMVMSPLADIFFPAWGIQQKEIDELAKAWAAVIDKYMPGGLSLGVEINAALITAMIVGPRVGKPRKPEEVEPENEEGGNDANK